MNPSRPIRFGSRRRFLLVGFVVSLSLAFGLLRWNAGPVGTAASYPQIEISRESFVDLVESLSEPEGYFDTDNFISNETSYLHVVPALLEAVVPGGVYFGVGPDQNFSYIVHAEPSVAVVADIRRLNMLQHLLFKVLLESSEDRADFLCALVSRNCAEVAPDASLDAILALVRSAPVAWESFERRIEEVHRTLVEDYGFSFSEDDLDGIEYVYRSFVEQGLDLRFSSFGRSSAGYPSLEEMILETDREGRRRHYLASPELFTRLRRMQLENLIIPVVGDFAGDQALPAIAAFLSERGLSVSVFYASNVEFYLFGRPAWDNYLDNLRAFPFSRDAVFIRSYFGTFGPRHPQNVRGHRATSLIQAVSGFLDDAAAGRLRTYWDVVSRHTLGQ